MNAGPFFTTHFSSVYYATGIDSRLTLPCFCICSVSSCHPIGKEKTPFFFFMDPDRDCIPLGNRCFSHHSSTIYSGILSFENRCSSSAEYQLDLFYSCCDCENLQNAE
ncbi:hypothetical protein D3C86_1855400 [compost metagenome]